MIKGSKTAIIILTYNNIEYSKACVDSIRKYTNKELYELIIIDNGSTDGTREWLLQQRDIKLKLNEHNEGFPKGCNLGIALADKDSDILLLNNDTVVTPRWLENLNECLYADDKTGAAGAVCNHNENLQGGGLKYDNLEEMQQLAEANNISDSGRWEEKVFLIGFCILIRREVIDKIGLLDESYSPGYVEDNDLSIRIIKAGYRLMLCHDCFVHHYLGSGFRTDLSKFYPVLFANRRTFKTKWGFDTREFDTVKHASLTVLKEQDKTKDISVLDIGCGIGITLLKVRYEYPHARLYGWEPNEHMADIAGRFAKVATQKSGAFPIEFDEKSFDYIIADNYAEKAEDPEEFLATAGRYLKSGGFIICTFNNIIQHYSAVREILRDNWYYTEAGTPARRSKAFFTYGDILKLFEKCGYTQPYIFHWFSAVSEQEKAFIQKLCEAGEESRGYLFSTYAYSVRFCKA